MTARGFVPALALAALLACPAAAADRPAFRHERDVIPGARGGNRLDVDVTLLSGLRGRDEERFADLRLFAANGQEVPYLLVTSAPVTRAIEAARIVAVPTEKSASGFEADFGAVVQIDRLEIEGLPAPFMKRSRLDGSADRVHWIVLEADGTLFDLPAEGLRRVAIDFPPTPLRFVRITWDDTASARVPLPSGATAREAGRTTPPSSLRAVVAFERRSAEPGMSRFRLRLSGPRLPAVAIEVVPAGGNVLRRATVSEARLAGNTLRPVELGSATLRRSERGGLAASDLRIPITTPHETELDLAVVDGDNPALAVREVAVILAPQPWIYFESPDGTAVTARYGADGCGIPRYDLEVVRGEVEARGAEALAAWGTVRERPEPEPQEAAGELMASGARIVRKRFTHARAVSPGSPGLTVLPLDLAVLESSPDLADVRIVTDDDRQVPYLLEQLSEPLAVELAAPERLGAGDQCGVNSQGGSWSCYRIGLPADGLPAGRLVVRTNVRVFARKVLHRWRRDPDSPEVLLDPHRSAVSFVTATDTVWGNRDPERPAPPLSLPLPPRSPAQHLLAIEDGDNSPLTLISATVYLPSYRLRFFRAEGSSLSLLYGARDVSFPRYDIALMAPRLLGASARDAKLEAAAPADGAKAGGLGTKAFWAVVIAAAVFLLLFIVRLLRSEGGREQ